MRKTGAAAAGKRGGRPHGAANGAVAQLGERLLCKQEAVGSIPSSSTKVSSKGQRHRAVLTSHHLAIASQQPSTLAIVASAER